MSKGQYSGKVTISSEHTVLLQILTRLTEVLNTFFLDHSQTIILMP